MARWAVIFDDKAEVEKRRDRFGPAHRSYLRLYEDQILQCGALHPDPASGRCGALWIVEADAPEEVEALVVNDPIYSAQDRSYRILAWSKSRETQRSA